MPHGYSHFFKIVSPHKIRQVPHSKHPGGDVETLIAEIEQRQLKLTKVLLTHGHFDHVAGTAQIVEHFHVPVYGPHKDDNFLIEDLEQQCRMFNFPSGKSFTPDQWLNEGDTVTIGKTITLSVLHCPR